MSMGLSPILGFVIDRVGKRALFVMISSVISFVACVYTALGFAYSIYASALWGSIPYAVNPKTIGSAFGLTTALQNAGLTLSPFITGFELNAS